MKPLAVLPLFLLGSCGIVHIEIRDREPRRAYTEQSKDHTPSQTANKQRPQEQPQETREQPTTRPPQQRQEQSQKTTERLSVQSPVRGRATRSERGYFINTQCGEFFRAVGEGRVLYAGDDLKSLGWVVMVDTAEGVVHVYAKASGLLVKRGETVKRGQPLGRVGSDGGACGLLFEVRDREGKPLSFELAQ